MLLTATRLSVKRFNVLMRATTSERLSRSWFIFGLLLRGQYRRNNEMKDSHALKRIRIKLKQDLQRSAHAR